MAKQGCQKDEFVPVWKLICLDFSDSIVSVHFASAIDRLFEVEFDTSLAAWTLPLHKIVCGLPPPKLGGCIGAPGIPYSDFNHEAKHDASQWPGIPRLHLQTPAGLNNSPSRPWYFPTR